MKNYLAILRRADFIDLYKYGFFYLNKELIVQFNCDLKEVCNKSEIYDELFSKMNAFESSFTYLIIHYEKVSEEDFSSVAISEVKHIYPFDLEAKKEFENSFDEHIRIEMPLWDDAVSLLKKKQMFQSSIQGIKNVFKIFGINGVEKCKIIISDDIVEDMLSEVYDNIKPKGNKSIWVYLIRYERHSFYPKESIGYYMDIVHIVCNFMAKYEVEDYQVEETLIYQLLKDNVGKNLKSKDINHKLEQNESAKAFLERIAQFVPEVDFITTAINYLKMRDMFNENFTYDKKFIEQCKSSFGESFTLASYMIGIALAHVNTYSCLYETLPLAIYKSKKEMANIELRKQKEREKAEREMQRIEEEKEKERQYEIDRRKAKKKSKKESYNTWGETGLSRGRGGYSDSVRNSYTNFHPLDDGVKTPPHYTQTNKTKKKLNTQNSLFPQYEDTNMVEEERKLQSFPLTLQKYTKTGKPSVAKNSTVDVYNVDEYKKYTEKSNEKWKIKK